MNQREVLNGLVTQMQVLCSVLRESLDLNKNTGLLIKHQTARMNALLLKHGIEKLPDVMKENALLVEQNVILTEQHTGDIKSLLRLQAKLDGVPTSHSDIKREAALGQAGGV